MFSMVVKIDDLADLLLPQEGNAEGLGFLEENAHRIPDSTVPSLNLALNSWVAGEAVDCGETVSSDVRLKKSK